ncbi:hypothetical protein GA0115240_15374 [Streptomyces sp. DvalAA-14]|nr:hypothetical protein GA0115240_15374 [Streptomyces sp. DvalAA-14]
MRRPDPGVIFPRQLQQPPPQQPPPPPLAGAGADDAADEDDDEAPTDTVDSSFTVSSWPCGHGGAAALACDMGRRISKVAPQDLHRYS